MTLRSGGRTALLLAVVAASSVGLLGTQVAVAEPSAGPSSSPTPRNVRPAAVAGPTAVDDAATVPLGGYAQLAGATNDQAGAAPILIALTAFPADQVAALPKGSTVSEDGKTLKVVNHGTFSVNRDGSVTFTPWTGRTGNVSARYRITDRNGATADGGLSVVVTAGGARDDVYTYQDVDLSVDVLANDTPGRNADGTAGVLDRSSARFPDQSTFGGVTISPDRRTLVDHGVGVLTLSTTGILTFEPDPLASAGTQDTIAYSAQDTTKGPGGAVQHQTYDGFIYLLLHPNQVNATSDFVKTPFNASVTLPGVTNDSDTNPAWPLRPELSTFTSDPADLPPGVTLSTDRRTLGIARQGTFSIQTDGSVLFVPVRGFVGETFVFIDVYDSHGNTGQEQLDVTVRPGPTAKPDTATIRQNETTAVDVLGNDVPGKRADGKPGSMDATFVRFPVAGQPAGATVSAYQRVLTVPGEGVYTADRTTGTIAFDPEPSFLGKASPVTYTAQDSVARTDGRVVHNPVTSTLTVAVTPVTPVALNNWATGTYDEPLSIAVLGNDRPGAASAPLDPASLRLRLTAGLPAGSSLSADARTLIVTGRGTFVALAQGTVRFTPVTGFVGRVPTVGYTVADANGTRVGATITVQVGGAAVMRPSRATVVAGETLVVDVLANDDPPQGVRWDRSSVCLEVSSGCVRDHSGSGYSWHVDPADGTITFSSTAPDGGSAAVTYRVRDTGGTAYRSTLAVTIQPTRKARG